MRYTGVPALPAKITGVGVSALGTTDKYKTLAGPILTRDIAVKPVSAKTT